MLIKLENPGLFIKAIELLSELVTDVRLRVNEFGLSITAIDPANVAMVGFKIPKSAFSQFETDNESLGINLDNLKKILKRCGVGSSLVMESKDNYINIVIQDRIRRKFSLALIEVEGEEIDFATKTGNMEFSSHIEINSVDLIASIEDCAVVADACSFIVENGKFIMESKGLNSARTEFTGDEARIDAEDCRARYSLEYLQKFVKGAKMCEKTILHFAQDHPLKIDFRTPNVETSFVLAPRVETED